MRTITGTLWVGEALFFCFSHNFSCTHWTSLYSLKYAKEAYLLPTYCILLWSVHIQSCDRMWATQVRLRNANRGVLAGGQADCYHALYRALQNKLYILSATAAAQETYFFALPVQFSVFISNWGLIFLFALFSLKTVQELMTTWIHYEAQQKTVDCKTEERLSQQKHSSFPLVPWHYSEMYIPSGITFHTNKETLVTQFHWLQDLDFRLTAVWEKIQLPKLLLCCS